MYGSDIEPIAVEIAKLSLLVSSLPLGNSWQIEQGDALADTTSFRAPPTIWVNQSTLAISHGFSRRMGNPVPRQGRRTSSGWWLPGLHSSRLLVERTGHRDSRREISTKCSVFEVWRMPRDMFKYARFPAAVVFAQKRRTAQRTSFAFRWLTAGSKHRKDFLDMGTVQFQSTERTRANAEFVGGPVDRLTESGVSVTNAATVRAGVVQRGTPCPSSPGDGIPVLARGAPVVVHRPIDAEAITWVSDPTENYRYPIDRETRAAPRS